MDYIWNEPTSNEPRLDPILIRSLRYPDLDVKRLEEEKKKREEEERINKEKQEENGRGKRIINYFNFI